MQTYPLVTVIVPVYNVGKYLKRCLDSIINQTYENIEVLVINDGSTDNSLAIIEEFCKSDRRLKVFNQNNQGLSKARNTGINYSKGDYIVFVDSDDFISYKMIEKLVESAINNNSDIVMCNAHVFLDDDKNDKVENLCIDFRREKDWRFFETKPQTGKQCLYLLGNGMNHVAYVVAWNKLYRAKLFSELRYPVGKINEDEYLIHRILFESKVVSYVDERLYYYAIRKGSIMNKAFTIKNLDAFWAGVDRYEFCKENNISLDAGVQAMYTALIVFLENYYYWGTNKEVKEAKDYLVPILKKYSNYRYIKLLVWYSLSKIHCGKLLKFMEKCCDKILAMK